MPKARLPYLPSTELSDFEKEIRKFVIYMIETHGHGILKSTFFPLQRDSPITFLCLIVGAGSILARSVLIVLQKNNNAAVRRHFCHLCWVPFL